MAWNEPNLDATQTGAAADIVLRVVTTSPVNGVCVNPNGTGGTTIVSDLSFDPEKHITIQGTGMASLWGKCAWMRVSAFSIPDSGTRTVFRADFFEDRERESAENLNDID